ncbi:hypothetical protein [Desulforhopalus sp. IMCC35007]|uniref:hypothetical protein n=1 Tax=Desulforhopalus sp. IMCC35007 TaxID=2569543 RepID=UPI0010AE9308|nr:hypothetical protein [Desulforhopalus sp. IMCC35007]TKB09380.1 hypothetical protein FCL48_10515 [Desulforhopalus sp. IMCC35007]
MKTIYLFTLICLLGFSGLYSSVFAADTETERLEIIDQVYEMAPDGSYLQIGDYGITEVENIWREDSSGEKISLPLNRIQTGSTVKARIVANETPGMWTAEEIYLIDEGEQKEVKNEPSSSEIRLENGTWKN